MADDPHDKAAKLQADWERMKAEYGEDTVKQFIKKARKKKGPKGRRGRPVLADEVALSAMADLRHLKSVKSERKAAEAVADRVEGHSLDAKIHRLCRKFRERRKELMAEATLRHKPKLRFAVERLAASDTSVGDPIERSGLGEMARRAALEAELARTAMLGIGGKAALLEFQRDAEATAQRIAAQFQEIERTYNLNLEQLRRDQDRLKEMALSMDLTHLLGI